MERHMDFEGIENFRDFGGYDTACGRGLRSGLLYRSANHGRATPADLARLRELGISVVVDLRRPAERVREPSLRPEGFMAHVIENDLGEAGDPWLAALKDSDISADFFRADGVRFYREAPFEARHLDLFSRYFRALSASEGPVLVHCVAGKDRTGMLCALTHHMAGVRDDDLVTDYLLTNDETRIARRIPFMMEFVAEHAGRAPTEAAVRTALSVHPEYLQAAFAVMREQCGSLDGYLEQALGVDRSMREAIAERILA